MNVLRVNALVRTCRLRRHRDPIFDMPYLENPRATSSAQKADAPVFLERQEKRRPVAALLGGRGR